MIRYWFPALVLALIGVTLFFMVGQQLDQRVAQKTMPPGTLYFEATATLNNKRGKAARTPDGRWWHLPDGTDTYLEVKP